MSNLPFSPITQRKTCSVSKNEISVHCTVCTSIQVNPNYITYYTFCFLVILGNDCKLLFAQYIYKYQQIKVVNNFSFLKSWKVLSEYLFGDIKSCVKHFSSLCMTKYSRSYPLGNSILSRKLKIDNLATPRSSMTVSDVWKIFYLLSHILYYGFSCYVESKAIASFYRELE